VEVEFSIPDIGPLIDTLVTYIDPTPPIPEFLTIPAESIGVFEPDTTYDIIFTTNDEDMLNGELLCFKLEEKKARDLWNLCQFSLQLGDTNEYACLPTAAASCLQYWADHGYPELARESPLGEEFRNVDVRLSGHRSAKQGGNPPDIDPYQMAEELAEAMGTSTKGTDVRDGVNGIVDYLGDRGHDDWYVAYGSVDNAADLAWALEEFEANGQDVILVMYDTTASHSDTTGHAVTLGSHANGANADPDSIDFMDPKDGMSGEEHTYPVTYNADGRPTTGGYNLDGDGAATVTGFLEVSPPDEEFRGRVMKIADAGQFTPGAWNLLDSGSVSGNGNPDTLKWNTTGFPAGTYLLDIRTTDAAGNTGRRLRMARVTGTATHAGGRDVPAPKTGLRGSFPNPFNPVTTIEFTLAAKTNVSLSIYDVSGRRVKRLLADEPRNAGLHRVEWDGTNDHGKLLASGVYFCKLVTKEAADEIKIIFVK